MPSMAAVCPLLKRQEDRVSMIWRLSVEASVAFAAAVPGEAIAGDAVTEAGVPGETVAGNAVAEDAVPEPAVPEPAMPGPSREGWPSGKASLAHSMSMRPSLHNTAMRSQILNKWRILPVQSA